MFLSVCACACACTCAELLLRLVLILMLMLMLMLMRLLVVVPLLLRLLLLHCFVLLFAAAPLRRACSTPCLDVHVSDAVLPCCEGGGSCLAKETSFSRSSASTSPPTSPPALLSRCVHLWVVGWWTEWPVAVVVVVWWW